MNARRLTPLLVLGALLAPWPLAGCSNGCTMIGGSSGVSVMTLDLPRSAPLVVEVCVGTICVTRTAVADSAAPVFVENSGVTSELPTDLTVAVRSEDGKSVVPVTHVVTHPRKHQPNGPGCEPTMYVADVTVGRTGVVRPGHATTGPDATQSTT